MTEQEFAEKFENYMDALRENMREKYNRVLPSGEYIFNRFDKAKYLNCGENTSIYDTSVVMGTVEIGDNVWVGPYTLLEGINAKLKIGNYVSIDAGVMIYTHDSTKTYVSGGKVPVIKGDVTIGSFTVIGTMSMIGCNVSVGEHCVIAAHSFVNKDVPDYSIVAGIPADIIGKVEIDDDGNVDFVYFDKNKCVV